MTAMGARVVVAGYLVRYPLGGYAWQALHFLAGFRALDCDVFFYEDSAYYAYAYVPGAPAREDRKARPPDTTRLRAHAGAAMPVGVLDEVGGTRAGELEGNRGVQRPRHVEVSL